MTDFSILNKEPWCGCCSNEHTFKVAEEICDHMIQKNYMRPMCVGSLFQAITIAQFMVEFVVAGKVGHDQAKKTPLGGLMKVLPFDATRELGGRLLLLEKEAVIKVVCEFMEESHDNNSAWEKEFLKKMVAVQELAAADAAFDKEGRNTPEPKGD